VKSFPVSRSFHLPVPAARAAVAEGGLEDIELARRIAAKDSSAFIVLMRRHNRVLYRAARSILKDEAESEDALQEAYLLAYRTIGQFRGEAKLSTWLVRIVVNEAIARSRKRARGEALAIRLDGEALVNPAAPEPPEHGAQRGEARRILQAKIDALPDALRVVFMLRAIEEMSVEEVAAALDIPKATVRTRFFRARHLLRAALPREIELRLESIFPFAGARCDGIVAAVLARLRRELPSPTP
jgi:RNA polymerase sigma-70 factor (ECF subfamily)